MQSLVVKRSLVANHKNVYKYGFVRRRECRHSTDSSRTASADVLSSVFARTI